MKKLFQCRKMNTFVIVLGIFLAFTTCKKDEVKKASLPTLNTQTPTTITSNSAVVSSFVSSDGGATITERGVCYSADNQNPSVTDFVITEGVGTGNYLCTLPELDSETKYYARAYALNSAGIGYSNLVSFTTEETIIAPNAAFTSTPISGTKPLLVSFTDQSTKNPTSWQWNFGDGNTSTQQNPSHIYQNAGNYTVELTVTNNSGYDTEIKSNYITVTDAGNSPAASFTGYPTSGTVPLTVSFTDQSMNNPTSWLWTFGDGSSSILQNPGHTYNVAGTYTVQLSVTNISGSDTEQKNNYINVTASGGTGTVTDIDGNVYQTVIIGTQEWMAENLKVLNYRNGEAIPNVTGNSQWSDLTTGAYCWYSNDISWKDAYGTLYNWYAVVDSRGLCPAGWHTPNDAEWAILTNYLGGEDEAGGKMKSTRKEPDAHPRWNSPNTGATNESGFSGLPGGTRFNTGTFYDLGKYGTFRSSSEYNSFSAGISILNYDDSRFYARSYGKPDGFSVRCIGD